MIIAKQRLKCHTSQISTNTKNLVLRIITHTNMARILTVILWEYCSLNTCNIKHDLNFGNIVAFYIDMLDCNIYLRTHILFIGDIYVIWQHVSWISMKHCSDIYLKYINKVCLQLWYSWYICEKVYSINVLCQEIKDK